MTGHVSRFGLPSWTARGRTTSESCQLRAEFTMLFNGRSAWLREFIVMTWAKIPGAFRCLTNRNANAHPPQMIFCGCGCYRASHSVVHPLKKGATRCRRNDGHLRRIYRVAARPTGATRRIPPHEIPGAAATHLYPARMPVERLQDIPGHNSLELTQLNILEDETAINGSHSPFDPLMG
ncbi:hypothetical protein TBK1r_63600 [Stieleria magnilauensis]|uniref:Uncharacterized protein n=1 Tax=Stieleria magnilauensis TaxID=2527963 RepID=A0ABX5XZ65_9BACT|nr:hypothetical protein TBK1r_63600 [Planctomycetes bacterium TBK1r]